MVTVLCISLSALGHLNACVGLCSALQSNGHKVVFATECSWKGKLSKYGFEEVLYTERDTNNNEESGHFWIQHVLKDMIPYFRLSDKEKHFSRKISFQNFVNAVKYSDDQIQRIITSIRPDVIIQDNYIAYPSIVNSGIPYVLMNSSNPLQHIICDDLPPGCFGLPLNDKSNWNECNEFRKQCFQSIWEDYSEWMSKMHAPSLKYLRFQYISPYLNIHLYPRVLYEDYANRAKLGDEFMLIQHTIRQSNESFELPAYFAEKPGKIIYLSLGSIASADVELMKRLINILSKCNHKVIVSRGSKHGDYQLSDNMWGEAILPQLKVLEICDLFITHGGNNSFSEALYFGKPMIVMPLFADQSDNGQRLRETNLGVKVNPFTVSQQELLTIIDELINDDELKCRLKKISIEMKNCNRLQCVVKRIEQIVKINSGPKI